MSISASSQTTYSEICEDSTKNKKDEFSIRAGNTTEENVTYDLVVSCEDGTADVAVGDDIIEETLNPWRRDVADASLPEYNDSVQLPEGENVKWWSKMYAYIGPGGLIAVGYMDPGNWSTDIAGGSAYGYQLLFVVLLSSLIAMFLQQLALKLGLATNRDLAQACRDAYPAPVVFMLWIVMEAAICATDIAEVIGSAVALKLLFGLPLIAGVCITACDVLFVLFLNGRKISYLENLVFALISLITVSFAVQMGLSNPEAVPLLTGFLPSKELFSDSGMIVIAVGIIGATVMPHNLFLHSSIILTRKVDRDDRSKIKDAIGFGTIDSTVSLMVALFVNSSILIVAAATFHVNGYTDIATLEDAYVLLQPILKSKAAPILFGIALLASGQNSTLTGTLAGQIVMEGFLTWKLHPVWRRLLTRLVAIVPAVVVTAAGGDDDSSANNLLIWSQVILSFALPFAIVPLVHLTSTSSYMKEFVNGWVTKILAVFIALLIIALNILLLSSQ